MKLLPILILAYLGLVTGRVSYRNYKVYQIVPHDETAIQALAKLENQSSDFSPFQFWHGTTKVGHAVTLMVAPSMQQEVEHMLDELNVNTRVMIEDVQAKIDTENLLARNDVPNPVNWIAYNTLDEINSWLESLTVVHPNVVTLLKPGKSHEGRDIVGVKVDFTPSIEKQVVFMESNIHAREWITSAVNTYILNELLTNTTTTIRSLAEKYTWYFFPVMNPDGFVYTRTDRLWRKTRTRYNIFCWGADPNRNWGYQWMNGGASQNPCSDLYAGPRPFSEPSVLVMRDFIAELATNHDMVAYLDFHSFSQMLLLPYGHTYDHLDNYHEMMDVGTAAMADLKSVHGTEYIIGNVAETIYIATGSSMDWVKGSFNVPIVYTYELRDRGDYGFVLPADQIIPTAEETMASVISIFEGYERLHPSNSNRRNNTMA